MWKKIRRVLEFVGHVKLVIELLLALGFGTALRAIMQGHVSTAWLTPIWLFFTAFVFWLLSILSQKIRNFQRIAIENKFTIVPASRVPCIAFDGSDGSVTVNLSVFSAIPLEFVYLKAKLDTGTHPNAATFDHHEPQSIKRFKRERLKFCKRIGLEEKSALGAGEYWLALEGTAYFTDSEGERLEKEFKITARPQALPQPFRWSGV
jgi:hypothetical protein